MGGSKTREIVTGIWIANRYEKLVRFFWTLIMTTLVLNAAADFMKQVVIKSRSVIW